MAIRSNEAIYLAEADVAALDTSAFSVRHAIHSAFQSYSDGKVRSEPKTSIWIGAGHAFQSMAAVDVDRGYAALKWVGMVPPGGAAAANINATLLLSDARTGQMLCFMDARRATALRTAATSAVAALYLARQDSATIGFVGAGIQAESHLIALADVLPSLRTVYVNSRTSSTAQQFAGKCRELGFEATVATAQETVASSDVVVTTVPVSPNFEPFIEPAWVRSDAFVIAVDLGRPWKHAGLSDADLTVVDEVAMKHYAQPGNFIPILDHAQATLADLAGGRHQGRTKAQERIMMFSSGSAVADLAIAILLYERARAKGIGTPLKV